MWLRIDDRMHSHRKVVSLSNAALGLWLRCASWSAGHETDGFVPDDVVRDYSADPWRKYRERAALIRAGLWNETDGGVVFHDWLDFNPSAAELAEIRQAAATRQRRSRARRQLDLTDDRTVTGHDRMEWTR